MKVKITEYLDVDLDSEMWVCNRCGRELISARENYKKGCRLAEKNPTDVHNAVIPGSYSFAPDPEWCMIVEYYCPGCGTMIENEYLPPGHPLTHDIELDIDELKRRKGAKGASQ